MATKKTKEADNEQEYPVARIEEIDGKLVLIDPHAAAIIDMVNKYNCKNLFDLNAERIEYFKNRINEKGLTPQDVVITCINVNDPNGKVIAGILMPDYDWQAILDQEQTPVARGLAQRDGIQGILEVFDIEAAKKLKETEGVAVVVIDYGVAEIFPL
jgi:hypothetical protein